MEHTQPLSPLAVTPGEPAGIGPELCVQLMQAPPAAPLVFIADPDLLQARARRLGLPLRILPYAADCPPRPTPGEMVVLPIALPAPATPGALNPANAPYVLATLERAVKGCLVGEFAGVVTAPVHKGIVNEAGIPFTGHTEFLADLAGSAQPVMMLATEGLRVALATTHLPLSEVSAAITRPRLEAVLRVSHHALSEFFALPRPRILVAGLNPHAGEDGHLGREEIDIIAPLLEELRREGMDLVGPLPADTLFTPPHLQGADAVLAMYHDQGLPVLKYKGFGRAVNITLGLPFVRTSVDHGTALQLAGSGTANTGSLEYAIGVARAMAEAHRKTAAGGV